MKPITLDPFLLIGKARAFGQKHQTLSRGLQVFLGLVMLVWLLGSLEAGQVFSVLAQLAQEPLSLLAVLALMPLNWLLESKKWQGALAEGQNPTPFACAFRSVVLGLAFHTVSPFMAGDFAGRALPLKNLKLNAFARAMVFANGLQYLATTVFGLFGAMLLYPRWKSVLPIDLPFWVLPAVLCYLLLWSVGLAWWFKFKAKHILANSLWAILRYGVFVSQFGLMLWATGIELEALVLFPALALVYLIKSHLPSLNAVANLGIRETAAVLVFGLFGFANQAVAASLALWAINLLLPALLGILMFTLGQSKD